MFGRKVPLSPTHSYVTRWHENMWSMGSYSFMKVCPGCAGAVMSPKMREDTFFVYRTLLWLFFCHENPLRLEG